MPCTERRRIDYQPGPAALESLATAEQLRPDLRRQELIDYLVITAVSALQHQPWTPPKLHGCRRDRWGAARAPKTGGPKR